MRSPFKYFNSSPEVIRLTVMTYVRYPRSLCNVEDLLSERGIDICHETARPLWPSGSHCWPEATRVPASHAPAASKSSLN